MYPPKNEYYKILYDFHYYFFRFAWAPTWPIRIRFSRFLRRSIAQDLSSRSVQKSEILKNTCPINDPNILMPQNFLDLNARQNSFFVAFILRNLGHLKYCWQIRVHLLRFVDVGVELAQVHCVNLFDFVDPVVIILKQLSKPHFKSSEIMRTPRLKVGR